MRVRAAAGAHTRSNSLVHCTQYLSPVLLQPLVFSLVFLDSLDCKISTKMHVISAHSFSLQIRIFISINRCLFRWLWFHFSVLSAPSFDLFVRYSIQSRPLDGIFYLHYFLLSLSIFYVEGLFDSASVFGCFIPTCIFFFRLFLKLQRIYIKAEFDRPVLIHWLIRYGFVSQSTLITFRKLVFVQTYLRLVLRK